jgi:hypothetical protein
MSDEPNQNPKEKDPAIAFMWLLVGLAPIVILLSVLSPSGARPTWINPAYLLIFCAMLNLLGGFGCVRGVKDGGLRLLFGILLAGFFFVLSWGIVLFQACSHMNI